MTSDGGDFAGWHRLGAAGRSLRESAVAAFSVFLFKMPEHDIHTPERELIRWIRDNMGRSKIEFIGLQDMLERSRVVHAELIDLLEEEDDEGDFAESQIALATA